MSSTNRGSKRSPMDYYVTPIEPIQLFLRELNRDISWTNGDDPSLRILDPSAGGDELNPMSYPCALFDRKVTTIDIREDSPATYKRDYLTYKTEFVHSICGGPPNIIITNPPFGLAMQFIRKALLDVAPGGLVIMLLRLNYFGSDARKEFFQSTMPSYSHVHSKRMCFWPDPISAAMLDWATREDIKIPRKGAVDSIEYQHATWIQGENPRHTKLRVI